MTPDDQECTDCEGSGVMHQTERYCTCGAGFALSAAALEPIAPPDVAQSARVLLDHYDKPDCVEAVSHDFIDTLHGVIMLHSRIAEVRK